jgi:hypothetical protein
MGGITLINHSLQENQLRQVNHYPPETHGQEMNHVTLIQSLIQSESSRVRNPLNIE